MGAQGDGDYNDPNRYRTSIPVGDRLPTDDSDDDFDDFDVDDDNDDHDDVGDEEDMDSVFLMQLPVNHDMKFFVHPRASLQQANDNENVVRDIKIEKSNTDDLVDREDGSDVAVGPKAESSVNQPMEEEEEPQPGPSRNRSRDDEKEEDEMRSSSRYFRWWDEFDNSSDGSTDLDNDEQDSVLGGAKKRSRDDLDGNLRLQGDLSLMTLSGHHVHSSKNPASEERAAAKVGDFHVGAQETVEDTQSRENYDKENKSGKKRFKR